MKDPAKEKAAAEAAARADVEKKLKSQAWRLGNLYWIEDENGKKIKFDPNEEQRELHNNWHSLNVALKPRQIGISTYCAIRMLDFALFCPNKTCGIIDKTDDDAKKKLEKISFAYDHLDDPDDPATAGIGKMIKATRFKEVDNKKHLEFSNGSRILAGTNQRGGTFQFLWISELGHVSFYDPSSAEEIRKGALNTIHPGNSVIIESTHEGGKFGVFYALVKLAMETRDPYGEMDWRFHFFEWWRHVKYSTPIDGGFNLTQDEKDYFKNLAERGIRLSDEQRYWYVKKKAAIGDAMVKEYPSVVEECFEAVISGAIYGKLMTALRMKKRIYDFEHDRMASLWTFWDIGFSDFTAIWLLQFVGRDVCALNYYCNCREAPPHYVKHVQEWERKYELKVVTNYLPHDADSKMKNARSYRDELREAGMTNVQVVPVISDEWLGINRLRALLPRFYFHKTNCGQEWINEGRMMPSGIGCLEGYHTKEDASRGYIREDPIHDDNSHGAAALRVFSESDMRGLLAGQSATAIESQGMHKKATIMAGWNAPSPYGGNGWSPKPRTILAG